MSARSIRVLHVEDDESQRRLFSAQLRAVPDFSFAVTPAGTEDEAVAAFPRGFDLVVVDYHLTQGDGLKCVRRLRKADAVVPIITVSGVATPEIAAELLEAGADDYLSKDGLEPAALGKCIRAALARAHAWKARAPSPDPGQMEKIAGLFQRICRAYANQASPKIVSALDELETTARTANLSFDQALRIFDTTCDRLTREGSRPGQVKKILRPMILEIVLRLFDDADTPVARA